MAERLGRVARAAREASDLSLMDIAVRAGVSQSTILNFEQGRRWVQQTARIVEAYEHECGLERRELWQRAIDLEA